MSTLQFQQWLDVISSLKIASNTAYKALEFQAFTPWTAAFYLNVIHAHVFIFSLAKNTFLFQMKFIFFSFLCALSSCVCVQSQCVLDAFRVQGWRGGKANYNCGNIQFNFKRYDSFPLRLHRNDDLGKKLNEEWQKFNKTELFLLHTRGGIYRAFGALWFFGCLILLAVEGFSISFDVRWY